MKILITGATGYVGRHLIKELNSYNHDLYATIRKTSNTDLFKRVGVKLIECDITQKHEMVKIVEQFDGIIHLAFSLFPASDSRLNETGFENVVNYFKDKPIKRFVFISSALVYGATHKDKSIDESCPCNPKMYFAKQQLHAENKLLNLYKSDGFPSVILRSSEIYGGEGGFFKTAQLDGYINGKTPVIGSGKNAVSYTYVGDLIQAIISSLEKNDIEGQVFNINTPGVLTINDLIRLIRSKVKTKPVFRIPVFLGWIVASIAILLAKLKSKVPYIDFDIIRVATLQSGERRITKAEKILGFKPKFNDSSTGIIDCYFKN
jgi:nucleoside-diphosphate-sugar epimerase